MKRENTYLGTRPLPFTFPRHTWLGRWTPFFKLKSGDCYSAAADTVHRVRPAVSRPWSNPASPLDFTMATEPLRPRGVHGVLMQLPATDNRRTSDVRPNVMWKLPLIMGYFPDQSQAGRGEKKKGWPWWHDPIAFCFRDDSSSDQHLFFFGVKTQCERKSPH